MFKSEDRKETKVFVELEIWKIAENYNLRRKSYKFQNTIDHDFMAR